MLSLYRHCDGPGLKLENPSIHARVLVPQALYHSLKLDRHIEGTCGLNQFLVMLGLVFDNKIYLKKKIFKFCRLLETFEPRTPRQQVVNKWKDNGIKNPHFPFLSSCSAAWDFSVAACERLQVLREGNVRPKSASGREALLLAGTKRGESWLADCCYGSLSHLQLWPLIGRHKNKVKHTIE